MSLSYQPVFLITSFTTGGHEGDRARLGIEAKVKEDWKGTYIDQMRTFRVSIFRFENEVNGS